MTLNQTISPFIIEPFALQDIHALQALQPEGWGDIIPNSRWYLQSDYCYSVKIEVDGILAGTGALIMNDQSAWIANIIVLPAFRNRGIGYAVTNHLIEYSADRFPSLVLVATILGFPIYTKLGFKPDGAYIFFHKHRLSTPVHFSIRRFSDGDEHFIYELDRQATGENRSHILKPFLQRAWVFDDETGIRGFCMPHLGEGLNIAETEEAGLALMNFMLLEARQPVLPAANEIAIKYLIEHGFTIDSTKAGTRMYRGENPEWKPEYIYGRIGGNVG